MAKYDIELKQFAWEGKLRIENITIVGNKLSCQDETDEDAQISINSILDLIAFYREKDTEIVNLSGNSINNQIITREQLTCGDWSRPYLQEDMEIFLAEAYLRYRDESFRRQTGVDWVLQYYLSALSVPLFQTCFLALFSALELLLSHVTPPAAEGPLAGLIHAVRKIPSIPSATREIAATRLAAPNLAERMVEFVRLTGIKGVAFQASYEERYRFDELLRIKEEFSKKGYSPRYGKIDSNIKRYCRQLKDLIRESIQIMITQL